MKFIWKLVAVVGLLAGIGVAQTKINIVTQTTGTLPASRGGTGDATLTGIPKANGTSPWTPAISSDVIVLWTGSCSSSTFLKGDGSCGVPAGGGTVTGASFSGGLISVTGSTTLAFTVAGTSGGIPYFSSSASWASSAALGVNQFVLGGGAGSSPTTSFSIVPVASGGTGAGTLTGPVKGNGTSPFTAAVSTDIIGLWTGTCSSTTFLRGDGSCQAPSGSGNTTSTSLTTNFLPKANGATSLINSLLSDTGASLGYTGANGFTVNSGGSSSIIQLADSSTNCPGTITSGFGALCSASFIPQWITNNSGTPATTVLETQNNKGQNGGYASLDGTANVFAAQLANFQGAWFIDTGNTALSLTSSGSVWTSSLVSLFQFTNSTLATSTVSQSSPNFSLCGTEWHAAASTPGCMNAQFVPGSGTDAARTFNFTVTGNATGVTTSAFPGPLSSGNDGVHAGYLSLPGNTTAPAITANTVGLLGPSSASFTAYALQLPSTNPSGGQLLQCGTPSSSISTCTWVTGSSAAFNAITSGTNTTAAMIVGTGASLTVSGSGTINSTSVNGNTFPASAGFTSGGVFYASSTSAAATSALLVNHAAMFGGGAGAAPTTDSSITTDASGHFAAVSVATGTSPPAFTVGTGGAWGATEGTAATGLASTDILFALASNHRFEMILNNGSALILNGIAAAGTAGDCVQLAANGIDNADSGAACGSGSNAYPITVSGTVTSGGIPYFSATTTQSSSGVLTSTDVVLGGGAGAAPNVSNNLTFVSPTLTIGVAGTTTGILKIASVTATGSVSLTPASAASAFTLTLPAITDTVVALTATQTLTNKSIAASEVNSGQLAVAQGGTALASGTSGGILGYTATGTLASSVALTANVLVKGGGAGSTPLNSLRTDNATTLTYTGTGGLAVPVVAVGTSPPTCTIGTAGTWCATEGTAPTAAASVDQAYADSTAHTFRSQVNGGSPGLFVIAAPGSIRSTGLVAAVTTATLCASSAGACNQAGTYHIHASFYQSGAACTTNTTGGITPTITWTDGNATAHSAVGMPLDTQSSLVATSGTMLFNQTGAALSTVYATGDFNVDTNGSIIQYAIGFAQCSVTGTATYAASFVVTRLQ